MDIKYIIPEDYYNLGLDNNLFQKESDKIYYYNKCPSSQINDVINLSPKEAYWKARFSFYLKSTTKLKKATFYFPRF